MNKDIIPILFGLFFGLMPIWITFAINPLWSIRTRKKILVALFILFTSFLIYIATSFTPNDFTDLFAQHVSVLVLFLSWILLIYRVYQLWPRRKE